MKLTKISLNNFRNYSNVVVNFNSNMNIFIGNNAQGKTNLLEAIVILALTKSHRIGVTPNIIQFNKNRAIIKGTVKKDKVISKLEVIITEDIKKTKVNGDEIKKVADYISNLNVIVFTPDDLEIIKSSPNIRRNLLNIQLSQISKQYLNTYNEYNKILKTRNEYLKILFNNSIADKDYLDILTDKLIEKVIIIYQKRKEYLDFINQNIDRYYKEISGIGGLKVCYVPNIEFDSYEYEDLRRKMKHVFKKNYLKELNYGMTMYGPHRDDFFFELNGNNLKFFGSQGQQRLAILSFKLAEIDIFTKVNGTTPILLLDDIFSELDLKKRNKLLKFVSSKGVQSFLTMTDLKNINKKYLDNSYIYEIMNGKVERK
ncbi:MAG: DNA replication/repair protein RecF [bacterium]|nr:DNA replication/repair protein RecF [bacterium]